ncbi:MAG: metalloregulator ArsR/SmtB family transcription factor [Candidatus Saccharimonadales bacterium]
MNPIVSDQSTITLTPQDERLIFTMQLLGDATRYKIFKLLLDGSDRCVGEIAAELDISISAVSQHFRHFERLGLVDKQRTGQKICYLLRCEDELVEEVTKLISSK